MKRRSARSNPLKRNDMTEQKNKEVTEHPQRPSLDLRNVVDNLCEQLLTAYGSVKHVRATTGDPSAIPTGHWIETRGGRGMPGMPGVIDCAIIVEQILPEFRSTLPGPFGDRTICKLIEHRYSRIEIEPSKVVFYFEDGTTQILSVKEAESRPPVKWVRAEQHCTIRRPRWRELEGVYVADIEKSPLRSCFTSVASFAEVRVREFKTFLIEKAGLIELAREMIKEGLKDIGPPGEQIICYSVPTKEEKALANLPGV